MKNGGMIMCCLVREEGWRVEKWWDWPWISETNLIHIRYNPTPILHEVA
jgi:hypothetical protein